MKRFFLFFVLLIFVVLIAFLPAFGADASAHACAKDCLYSRGTSF